MFGLSEIFFEGVNHSTASSVRESGTLVKMLSWYSFAYSYIWPANPKAAGEHATACSSRVRGPDDRFVTDERLQGC